MLNGKEAGNGCRRYMEDRMPLEKAPQSTEVLVKVANLLIWSSLLAGAVCGQTAPPQPGKLAYSADQANVPDAIAKVKSGDFLGVHAGRTPFH
jgi:hypothetical protein